jgi:DNA/RNA endonuclease YhcR with UshA esterase domain
MRIIILSVISIVLTSSVSVAGNHGSTAPWSSNSSGSSSGKSLGTSSPRECLPIAEASKHVRKQTCVTGTVIRVEEGSHGVTFLDFCLEYRNCPFTVVVFPGDMKKVGDVRQLQGRVVAIQGRIEEYDDRAEIILRRPQQLGEGAKLLNAMPKDYDVEKQGHFSPGSFRAAKVKTKHTVQGAAMTPVDPEEP